MTAGTWCGNIPPEGKLLLTIGTPGKGAPFQQGLPFNRPTKVAFDPRTGDLYIADGYGNSRIHKYLSGRKASLLLGRGRVRTRGSSICRTASARMRKDSSMWPIGKTTGSRSSIRKGGT